jgi:mannose-1-phosphate guanylyltransferase/mannose-6-phosphate isomerase
MAIFPVILCGGSGSRLWPASRPGRPKQFLDLTGDLSLFQDTVRRVAPLAGKDGKVIVVAGVAHKAFVIEQLASSGVTATVLLEPAARDSAPAMAAAAIVVGRMDPAGVALFVASDHHIPDAEAFRSAVFAGEAAAREGRIVTFGVRPTEPSSAYGYICPERPGLSPVKRFVEKPDAQTAEAYVRDGYLWNSGNFMVAASTLLAELRTFEPNMIDGVQAAVPEGPLGPIALLGEPFQTVKKVSIDYAVMERSDRVSVLPVDFSWSDLGAWDAVASSGAGNRGVWIGHDGDTCLVRAASGMVVATAGVTNLAIIAEHDAVLVCSLDRAQEVKGLVERLGQVSPAHLQAGGVRPTLAGLAPHFADWVCLSALPLWGTLGIDPLGGFGEAIGPQGARVGEVRRARVQGRQVYVYGTAGRQGWAGPWALTVSRGLERFEATNRREDGLYRTQVSADGTVLDDTPYLYDQAFALLGFAAAAAAGVEPERMRRRARDLFSAMDALRVEGGWREAGDHPFQANAHMHLLEACLAWEALDPDGPWADSADAIVALARRAFIDPERGFLREFFQADWSPAAGPDGGLVEPGHQFEWAWLLTRWGRLRNDDWARSAARSLYAAGGHGVDDRRGVAVDELDADLSIRSSRARLWPQTERLKAALILAEESEGDERRRRLSDAADALAGLQLYLQPTGLWRDKMKEDGSFVEEPAPASSFYHIMAAYEQLRGTARALPDVGWDVT